MGLDVYLYRWNDDAEKWKTRKERYGIECEAIEKLFYTNDAEYNALTEERKEEMRAKKRAVALELELDEEYGDVPDHVQEKIEIDSAKYPEHMFKIGYLRSSYNSGGINSMLRSLVGKCLYDVFAHEDGEYEFVPDWNDAKEEIASLLAAYRELKEANGDTYVMSVGFNQFSGPTKETPASPKAAMDAWIAERGRNVERLKNRSEAQKAFFGDSYSNILGEFHLGEPLKVRAAIPGLTESFMGKGVLPVVYLICDRTSDKEDGGGDWYERALEITEEMVDWVLAQDDPSKFCLHWSS